MADLARAVEGGGAAEAEPKAAFDEVGGLLVAAVERMAMPPGTSMRRRPASTASAERRTCTSTGRPARRAIFSCSR